MKIVRLSAGHRIHLTDTEYAGLMWLVNQGWGAFEGLSSSDWDCLDRHERQGLKRLAHKNTWAVEDRRT